MGTLLWWWEWGDSGGNSVTAADTLTTSDSVSAIVSRSRTASDSLTTSDSVSRTGSFNRTETDSLTTSDAVTQIKSLNRTAADSLTTSDAVTRTGTFTRTETDSLTTSDAVTRTGTFNRTASDSLTTSSTVVATAGAVNRTASDSLTTSDTAARTGTFSRTASDTLTTSDAAVDVKTNQKTASDTLTISTSVARTGSFHRTASDSLTVSTSVDASTGAILRSASDSLTVSTAVTRTGAFVRSETDTLIALSDSAVLTLPQHYEFTADDTLMIGTTVDAPTVANTQANTTYVYIGGTYIGGSTTPGAGSGGGTGSGDAAGQIEFATASFTTYVNGKPGEAYMRVRDLNSTVTFNEGDDWVIYVNGGVAWRGYVTQVVETYYADVVDLEQISPMRVVDIRGSDINLLFSKRVTFNKSNPADPTGTKFPAGTADTTAITDLVNHWLDLSSDSLDLTSGVEHVGDLDPDEPTRAWSGGWTWGDAMSSIAMLPAAIYYIRPESGPPKGTLVYCDVDVPTAPFGLSDQPNGTTTRGYREMEIILDGTSLANDVLGWGMGYGSMTPVFSRDQDSASQSAHGLWQTATVNPGVYKQGTIDRITDSILNGSPSSKRGAKNNRPAVRLTTYEPGLFAGHVVAFESAVWGFVDDIPVRQLTLTFEAPDTPRYEIMLSHEIDAPWGFIDQFWPHIPFPNIPTPGGPGPVPPGRPQQTDGECDCGITDTFTREVIDGWGTSDAGFEWFATIGDPSSFPEFSVTDGHGAILAAGGVYPMLVSGYAAPSNPLAIPLSDLEDGLTFDFTIHSLTIAGPSSGSSVIDFQLDTANYYFRWSIYSNNSTSGQALLALQNADFDAIQTPFVFDLDATYHARVSVDSSFTLRTRVWSGSTEPTSWDLELASTTTPEGTASPLISALTQCDSPGTSVGPLEVYFDNLDLPGIDRCSQAQIDDFDRPGNTVGDGWGSSTPSGYIWTTTGQAYLDGEAGVLYPADSASSPVHSVASITTAGPWDGASTFLMRFRFGTVPAGSTNESTYLAIVAGSDNTSSAVVEFKPSATAGEITLYSGSGAVVVGTTAVQTSRSWTAGVVYAMRWEHNRATTGTDRIRVWEEETESEPSTWDLELGSTGAPAFSGSLSGPLLSFDDFTLAAHRPQAMTIESIDADYATRPCYYDCANFEVLDDFSRSIDGSWGTVSSGTYSYTQFLSGAVTAVGEFFPTAGVVVFDPAVTQYAIETLAFGSGDGTNWQSTDGWDVTFRFWDQIVNNTLGRATFFDVDVTGTNGNGLGVGLTFSNQTGIGSIYHQVYGDTFSDDTVAKTDWLDGSTPTQNIYKLRWLYAPNVSSQIKVWLETDPEPSAWTSTLAMPTGIDLTDTVDVQFGISNGATISTDTQVNNFFLAEIFFGSPCEPVEASGGAPPQSPWGFGCEVPTSTGGGTYRTSAKYLLNSTLLLRDGRLQRRGSDYDEDSDQRTITFSTPPGGSASITVCYIGEVTT